MENNGKGIFYGVIGVATLIVAIIGATFAYFTASAPSNDNVIKGQTATAASMSLAVDQVLPADDSGKQADAGRIVPLADTDLETALKRGCVDSNGYVACQVYEVTVSNDTTGGDPVRTATSVQLTNMGTIANLKWQRLTALATSENANVDSDFTAVTTHGAATELKANTTGVVNGTPDVYYFVVWLSDNNDQTTSDAGKTFGGTVSLNMVNADGTQAGTIQATFK